MPITISDEVLKAAIDNVITIKAQAAGGLIVDTGVPAPPVPAGPSDEALAADVSLAMQLIQQPYSSVPSGQYVVHSTLSNGPAQNSRQVAGHIDAIVNDVKYAQMGGRAPTAGLKYTGITEIGPFGESPISLADIVAKEPK